MHWTTVLSALLGSTIPAVVGSVVMLQLKKRIDETLEYLKRDFQEHLTKFIRWHEKRVAALEVIYQAFCKYLDFLRRTLYVKDGNKCLDPMHDFRNTLEQQVLYLDDSMAQKISQYQGELLLFWSSALRSLSAEGESARENIRRQLDFEIPAYLPRLQEDINEFLDPSYKSHDKNYRRTILGFLSKQTPQGSAVAS
jgi:hypothetical protein